MWAMNVGAYNFAFAFGLAVGLLMVNTGNAAGGTSIVLFAAQATCSWAFGSG